MRARRSNPYDALALYAGGLAGMKKPTPKAVAENKEAHAIRDSVWEEYERMLRDTQTYSLKAIVEYWADPKRGVRLGHSSVHRDRLALTEQERRITLIAAKTRATIEAAGEGGAGGALDGARLLASQLLFSALGDLSADALGGLTGPQILQMLKTLGYLSKTDAEANLMAEKVREMQQRFDKQIAAVAKDVNAGDGRLTDEQIAELRRVVFGKDAA